jgi:hypothetical protein
MVAIAIRQTRSMSLVESIANTGAGFALSLLIQMCLFSWMSIETTTSQNLVMSIVFTAASLVRGYLMRRLFLWFEESKP